MVSAGGVRLVTVRSELKGLEQQAMRAKELRS